MEREESASRLFHACQVLFGPDIDVSGDFLRYLQMAGLKAVYRKRALESHPDRAVALASEPLVLEEKFKEVHAAYRDLHDYLSAPWPCRGETGRRHPCGPAQTNRFRGRGPATGGIPPWESDRRYSRPTLPQRTLLFGQYIYYSGAISYRELIDALVWQKVQRPLLGQIGVLWKWLGDEEVRQILRQRQWGERFGEAALRGGYLTPAELTAMLGRQRLLQPRIGRYFVEKRILAAAQVEELAEKARRHNRAFRHRAP